MKQFLRLLRENRLVRLNFILIAIGVLCSVVISLITLQVVTMKDREQSTNVVFTGLYTAIEMELQLPAELTKTMCHDSFLQNLLSQEETMDSDTFERTIAEYLTNLRDAHGWETAYVLSDRTRKYYTPEGFSKIVDETKDPYDVWYPNFLNTGLEYAADISYDQQNDDTHCIYIDRRMEVNGELIGLVGCSIYVSDVREMLKRYSDTYDVNVYFTNVDGDFIFSADGIEIPGSYLPKAYNTDETERHEGYEKGVYTIRQYMPMLGLYLVVENSQHLLSQHFYSLLTWNVLFLLIFFLLITIFNQHHYLHEKHELKRKVRTDYLTKISNLAGLEHSINLYTADTTNEATGAALFIFDLDHFKEVNDTFGHSTGDEVLIRFAHKLTKLFRGGDIIGRLGGDEFMVFSPGMSDETVLRNKAEELNRDLCDHVIDAEGHSIDITVSIGVARYPMNGTSYQRLYEAADLGLYYVKEHGRNSYACFDDLQGK